MSTTLNGVQLAPPEAPAPGKNSTRSVFRPDIEGLRAIAVVSVILYHLSASLLPGGFIGVDVFFVISGFLITSHLVREHRATGRISLARFYARRALRLIPAATVTLLATVAAILVFVPRTSWDQFGRDIIASACYVVNWTLAGQSINYLAEDNAASPVQHFWSLSVEEQYYLIWPLLIILAGLIAVWLKSKRYRLTVGIAGGIVIVASLGWALYQAHLLNPSAYFTTTTRLWELAVGAVAAVVYPVLSEKLTPLWRNLLSYVGLAALFASLILMSGESQWPNAWAVIPVVGAALVILAGGDEDHRTLGEITLGVPALVWIGGLSYSLYLWHWPLITIAQYVRPELSRIDMAAIIIASGVLAWATQKFIENPIRFNARMKSKARYGLIMGLLFALISAGAGSILVFTGPSSALSAPTGANAAGAAVLAQTIKKTPVGVLTAEPTWVTPEPDKAPNDVPSLYAKGCQQGQTESKVVTCTFGDATAKKTIVLVGDSKDAQWEPALDTIAKKYGYKLVTMTKSSCAFTSAKTQLGGKSYPSCDAWNVSAQKQILAMDPSIVITSQHSSSGLSSNNNGHTLMQQGLDKTWSKLRAAKIQVVVLAENPNPPTSDKVYDCVSLHPTTPNASCSFDAAKAEKNSAASVQRQAVKTLGGSRFDASGNVTKGSDEGLAYVDLAKAICPPQLSKCPAVMGNVVIYRQGSHVTATFAQTMAPRLETLLRKTGILHQAS